MERTYPGWQENGDCLVLAHYVIWGDPHDNATWIEMDGILKSRHSHELGGEIGLDAAVVDSGDGETMESVYAFCFPRLRRKILAGKGMAGNRPWIEASKTRRRGGRLFIIGVDGIKSHILIRLAHGRTIRFAEALPRV